MNITKDKVKGVRTNNHTLQRNKIMQMTIKKGIYFTSLDSRLFPCGEQNASYQLEKYSTDGGEVFALALYTGKFSYPSGHKALVKPRAEIRTDFVLNNIIENKYLKECLDRRVL